MTHVRTQNIRQAYEQYKRAEHSQLWHVYGRYSENKERAMWYCKDLVNKYNGERARIISHNSQIFTYGFIGYVGNDKAFIYITPRYDRYITLAELGES